MVRGISPSGGVPSQSPGDSSLQQALQQAEEWLQGPPPLPPLSGPDEQAAEALIQEIKSLQSSGGSMQDLKNWYNGTFNNQQYAYGDIYWQYMGISQNGVNEFCSLCGVNRAVETPADKIVSKIYALMNEYSNQPNSPNYQMFAALFNDLYTTDTSRSPALMLQQNAQSIVGNNFSNFPGITSDAKQAYMSIFLPQKSY